MMKDKKQTVEEQTAELVAAALKAVESLEKRRINIKKKKE